MSKKKLGVDDGQEDPIVPPEVPPVEETPSVPKETTLGTMGPEKIEIVYLGKQVVNEREYNDVHLADGTTYLMTDLDLKNQRST